MKTLYKIVAVLCIANPANYQPANAQVTDATFNPAWATQLQAAIDDNFPLANLHGVSVSIYFPGEGTFYGTAGESSPGVAMTSDKQFGVGSNTKLFVSVLALKLQELGVWSLDDPLSM